MQRVVRDLKEAGYTAEQIDGMNVPEMLEAWLQWHGISASYATGILAIVCESQSF